MIAAYGQAPKADQGEEVIIELRSPWIRVGDKTVGYNKSGLNCVSLVTLQKNCISSHGMGYGARIGKNWDIFQIFSRSDRTRMIDLGQHTWDDQLVVPIVEPWPALLPGQQRHITINASGGDGKDGRPGMNADGTLAPQPKQRILRRDYAGAPLTEQVSSSIVRSNKVVKADTYSPVLEAVKGHIYLAHIFDDEWDYYLLIRADDVVKGEKAILSFRKVPYNSVEP